MSQIKNACAAVMNVSTGGGLGMAEQVRKIRGIIESLGHRIATPAEARARLALKGAEHVTV